MFPVCYIQANVTQITNANPEDRNINTMYKDLTIAMDLARSLGVPLFTTAIAMQLFQAGKTKHPEADNWVVARVIEDIIGVELAR